ncbi:uncharacterized protein UTRI_00868 [Ustilago trichophora]|uniref:Uncharacterized protein n=1 Tax=Ustilago trichophora TaxID=86804 RepID=A0A5C3DVZ8_9BASI|nr:uncharacterized protein UTRI_00868 [Ustilago trichophora]
MIAQPTGLQITPTQRRQRHAPFSSERSETWYVNDSNSGRDKEVEDDGDTDSLTSAESCDSVATPESSPPQNRHAVLLGEDDAYAPAVGAFDKNGNWAWSTQQSLGGVEGAFPLEEEEEEEEEEVQEVLVGPKTTHTVPLLNRHDRTQMVMTGSVNKLAGQRKAPTVMWSDTSSMTHGIQEEVDDDDSLDVVGFTSYPSRTVAAPRMVGEGHSIVVPVRIRLEDDSSSDESEASVVTSSSSGSDSEARRRAGINMLQRLGKTITIPQRRGSVISLGQGTPRRPPSLDEISNRVVAGGGNAYGRGTPPGSAVPHQRSVSCPSPLPLQRQRFGEVEVMVTPATPKMSTEKIPGVVLKSPHMPSCAFSTDARGNLIAPAFDVAPGRQIMLEERERQAKQWLENFKSQQQQQQQQERQGLNMNLNLKLGAGPIAPPMANSAQAAAIISPPSSPTKSRSPSYTPQDGTHTTLRQISGGPPIPPRRRSFGLRIPTQQADAGDVSIPPANETNSVEVPDRTRSPFNVPNVKAMDAPAQSTMRRSLVARLSLRRSSKELREDRTTSSISRKPVPTV